MYDFEYDNIKSISNLKKHGIDFIAAQEFWLDSDIVEVQAKSIDREASRIGVTRQSIIKLWLVECLEEKAANK